MTGRNIEYAEVSGLLRSGNGEQTGSGAADYYAFIDYKLAARQTNGASYRKADGVTIIRDRQFLTQRSGAAIICVGYGNGVRICRNSDIAEQQHANCEGRGSPQCVVRITQHLTGIRLHLAIYFCLHRGQSAGKHGKLASRVSPWL